MEQKKEVNKSLDDVKVTIGGREIKGITSMSYESSNEKINYKKSKKMNKKKIIGIAVLAVLLLIVFKTCKSGDVNNTAKAVTTVNNDSINKVVLEVIKKESKVKDAVITEANVLYVSVLSDGTNRDGYASYFCETLREYKSTIEVVKIVEFGTMNSKNKDNAYGILLGESSCK